MRINREDSLLVVVDIQERLFPHMHRSDEFLEKVLVLIRGVRALDVPVVVTQQYTKGLGMTIAPVAEALGKEDPQSLEYLEKSSFSCMDEPAFAERLRKEGRKNIIVCGIESHVCVLQTVMDLAAAGYNPIPVIDCVSSRAESSIEMSINRYIQEDAVITSCESVLFELCRYSDDSAFKTISGLVKKL